MLSASRVLSWLKPRLAMGALTLSTVVDIPVFCSVLFCSVLFCSVLFCSQAPGSLTLTPKNTKPTCHVDSGGGLVGAFYLRVLDHFPRDARASRRTTRTTDRVATQGLHSSKRQA